MAHWKYVEDKVNVKCNQKKINEKVITVRTNF